MRPGRGTARRVYERVSVHAEAKSTNPTLWHDLGAPITEPRRPLPDFGVLPSPPRAPDGRMPTPHRPLVIRVGKRLRRLVYRPIAAASLLPNHPALYLRPFPWTARTTLVWGKRVSVRVATG